jgi:hypothetical protein
MSVEQQISPIPLVETDRLGDEKYLTQVFTNLVNLRSKDDKSKLKMIDDPNFPGPVLCLNVRFFDPEKGEPVRDDIALIVKGQLEEENESQFIVWLMNKVHLFTAEELAPVWNSLNEQQRQTEPQHPDEREDDREADEQQVIPEIVTGTLSMSEKLESFIGLGILPVDEVDIEDIHRQFEWLGEQRNIKSQKYAISLEIDENGPKLIATIQTPRSTPFTQDLIHLRTFNISEIERAVLADRNTTDHGQKPTAVNELIGTSTNNLAAALQLLMEYNVITQENIDLVIRKFGRNAEYAYRAIDGVGFANLPKWVSVINGWKIEKASDLYNNVIQLREGISMLNKVSFRSRWTRLDQDTVFQLDMRDESGNETNLISASVSEATNIKETESYIRLAIQYYAASGLLPEQIVKEAKFHLANENEDVHNIAFFQSKIHGSLSKAIIGREKSLDTVSLFFPNHDHKINTHIVYRPDSGTKRDVYYSTVLPEEMSATFESRLRLAKAIGLSIESKGIKESIRKMYPHIAYESLPVVMRTDEGKLALVLKYPYEQYSADINHTWIENSAALAMSFALDKLYRQYELLRN